MLSTLPRLRIGKQLLGLLIRVQVTLEKELLATEQEQWSVEKQTFLLVGCARRVYAINVCGGRLLLVPCPARCHRHFF